MTVANPADLHEQQIKCTANKIAKTLTEKKDSLLREAISRHLGTKDWEIDEIIHRLKGEALEDMQVITMDNKAIMICSDSENDFKDGRVTAGFKYKILS